MPTVGQIIASRRKQLGLSQPELAKLVGISERQVSRYETDDQKLSFEGAIAMSDALQISLGELAGQLAMGVDLGGFWYACWQTTREGLEQINRHQVSVTHTTDFVTLRAGGDYSWAGEFRVVDDTMGGRYSALERNERSLGQMFFHIHPNGDAAIGRWTGRWVDGIVGDGWGTLARTASRADRLMGLVHDLPYLTAWPPEDS